MSAAVALGWAAVLAAGALLPTTSTPDRVALLIVAGIILAAGMVLFGFVPRRAADTRLLIAGAAVAQGAMVVAVGMTGGAPSVHFTYYLLPVLLVTLSGSWRASATIGGLAAAGLLGLALSAPLTDVARDLTLTRLGQVVTIALFSAATALVIGATRRALAERTEALISQRDDAFQMAITDELTGLYNRHYMRDELRRMIAHASRHDRPFAIISLDVDGLKQVNDSRGHQAGDALLRGIAESLRTVLRSEDIPVRTGGDEFVVLLPDADRTEAVKVAHRIRQRIAALPDRGSRGVSSGIAVWRRGTDADDALRQADEELYRAKAARAGVPSA